MRDLSPHQPLTGDHPNGPPGLTLQPFWGPLKWHLGRGAWTSPLQLPSCPSARNQAAGLAQAYHKLACCIQLADQLARSEALS